MSRVGVVADAIRVPTPEERAAFERGRRAGAQVIDRLSSADRWALWADEISYRDVREALELEGPTPPGWKRGLSDALQAWVEAGAPNNGAAYGLDGCDY